MRHRAKGRQLSRTASHKKALLANLATSLFRHDRIVTTEAKAKELRPYAERLITLARRGDLHARRQVERRIKDREVTHRLFKDLGPASPPVPAAIRGSSSWAIAWATAPRWLGSNCWVRDGSRGERLEREGDPGSPFSLGRFRDAIRLQAAGADPQPARRTVHDRTHALQVGVPAAIRPVVRVADVVPRHGALATDR